MTDVGAGGDERHLGPVGRRLLAAFLAISLVSLAVLIVLSLWRVGSGLDSLQVEEHERAASTAALDVGTAYRATGGWDGIDLAPARATAHAAGGRLTLYDATGTRVAGPIGGQPVGAATSGAPPPTAGADVVVGGSAVGRVELTFVDHVPLIVSSRSLVLGWVLVAAVVGLLVAGAMGWWVSLTMLRPLRRLSRSAIRFADGDHTARAGQHDLPGELGGLSRAIDTMAEAVVDEESARKRVAADVAHELRGPLTTLQAGLEELSDGLEDPTPDRLAALHDESLRLGRVVEDLTLLSSAESRRPALTRHPCDLARLAAETLEAKAAQVRVSQLVVDTDLRPARVSADPDRMHQVIGNLIDNAIRYCSPGDPVSIQTAEVSGRAVLTVEDGGPGIPEADLPYVQDRLFRGSNAVSSDRVGDRADRGP